MPTPAQPNPPSGGRPPVSADDQPSSPGFEESLHQFWEKNRGIILGACIVVLLAIIGRAGWGMLQERRASARASAYAAATTDEQREAFARDHSGSALAGVARLKIADAAYEAGRYQEAIEAYEQAARPLNDLPLAHRARLGAAISRLRDGQTDAGRQALQQLANTVGASRTMRAEAAYHLASLAADSGAADDALRSIEQIEAIDPTGSWAQRAMMLRETVSSTRTVSRPAESAAPADETTAEDEMPTVSFPGATSP